MELLQLRYFFESAKNENFTKTANMFMVPTTSVSASIKRLEKELGCELFDRSSNRIFLNSNGRLLQQSLSTVFSNLENVVAELSANNEEKSEIKILVRSMRRKITEFITEYSKKHSRISFEISFDQGYNKYQNYDIIIDSKKEFYDDFEKYELFNMDLNLICNSDNILCNKKLSLKQLCNNDFVSMGTESNMYKILENACNREGFNPKTSIICNDIECYEKFIEAGMGIGIGFMHGDKIDYRKKSSISYLDVVDFKEHYTVYAYFVRKENYRSVKSFIDFMKSKSL